MSLTVRGKTSIGPKIASEGLVFAWDGTSTRSWDGTSSTHYDSVNNAIGTQNGINPLVKSEHILWTNSATSWSCYIDFTGTTVPTGDSGSWFWTQYFIDGGNLDHPNFGKETSNGWDGVDGFVFGTGWGTDGPRWGIGGTGYPVYADLAASTGDYRTNTWQLYCVTYTRNSATGLNTYLLDSNGMRLVDTRTSSDSAIGSNSEPLRIGATINRGGNWNGYMDSVYMWNRELTQTEVFDIMNSIKYKFGF